MDIETFRDHCLRIKGATESLPFLGHNVLVFKVMEKMFAMVPLEPKDGIIRAHMKAAEQVTAQIRERCDGVGPGFHPKSETWYSLTLESDVPDPVITGLINCSVEEVLKTLPKKKRDGYNKL